MAVDTSRAVGTIAAYKAQMEGIKSRRVADLERARQTRKPGSNWRHRRRRYDQLGEACERRHFGEPHPKTGLGLDSPARLWRWIVYRVEHLKACRSLPTISRSNLYVETPDPFWDALLKAYGHLHELRMHGFDVPEAPEPRYVQMTEDEAADKLRCIAVRLEAGDRGPVESPASRADEPRASVWLGKPGDRPKIRGKHVPRLTPARYNVIKALLDRWPDGLSKDELVTESGHGDAVNIVKTIYKLSPEWTSAIKLPGREGRGEGYRILPD